MTAKDLTPTVAALIERADEMEKLPTLLQASPAREIMRDMLKCMSEMAAQIAALTPYLDEVTEGAA